MIKEYVYKTLNVNFVSAYSNEFSVRQGNDSFVASFVENHALQCGGKKKGLFVPFYIFLMELYLLRNKCILVSNFQINRTRRVCDFVVLRFLYRVQITTGQMPCAVFSSFFVFWRTRPQKFGNRFRIISILYARIVIVFNVSLTPPSLSPSIVCRRVRVVPVVELLRKANANRSKNFSILLIVHDLLEM